MPSCSDRPSLDARRSRLGAPTPRRAIALLVASVALGVAGSASAQVVLSPHFLGVVGVGQDLEIRVDGNRVLRLSPSTGAANVTAGHPDNAIADGRVGGTIAGGGGPGTEAHAVWGDYGTVGGGRRNEAGGQGSADDFPDATVRGGDLNSAVAAAATVGGGWVNVASGNSSTISGGSSNEASGFAATIGGGFANVASGAFATIPGGQWAEADRHGQLAFSAGSFTPGVRGEAQTSLFVLRRVTSLGSPVELFLDGGAARLTVAPDRALAFRITAVGRSSGGLSAGYTASGVVANRGGTTSLVGPVTTTVLGEDAIAWDFEVTADDSLDALRLWGTTGTASSGVRWVATVEATEVAQ